MALPKLPRLRADLEQHHVELLELFLRHVGTALDSTAANRIAQESQYILGGDVTAEPIFQTLMLYAGRKVESRWCDLIARQLTARIAELKGGPLQIFERPLQDEWVPLEIYSMKGCLWRESSNGQSITFYCLAGHPAGHRLTKKIPERWLAWLAYQIGYSRRIPYDYDPTELIGMQLWGYLKAAAEEDNDLDFQHWQVSNGQKKHNRAILRLRRRFDIEPHKVPDDKVGEYSCPFELDTYCSQCRYPVAMCIASPNRDRINESGSVVDDTAAWVSGSGRSY